MSMKNSNDTTWNRTSDLRICSTAFIVRRVHVNDTQTELCVPIAISLYLFSEDLFSNLGSEKVKPYKNFLNSVSSCKQFWKSTSNLTTKTAPFYILFNSLFSNVSMIWDIPL